MSRSLLLLVLCLACVPVWAQEVATTNRATELKADSRLESATLASLPSGAPVKVIGRSSGWARVQSASAAGAITTGWVRAFHLRFQSTVTESDQGSGFGSMFGSLFGSRKQAPQRTATVGIRGLSEEEMKNAKPNPAEYARMKGYAATKASAEAFGNNARLKPTAVAFLDANGKPISGGAK